MKQIPFAEASREQLATYAEVVLGLPAPRANASQTSIVASIKTARGEDEEDIAKLKPIVVADEVARPVLPPAAPPAKARAEHENTNALRPATFKGGPTAEITLHEDETKEGKRPHFCGANGISILIPRNKRVEIAAPFFYALMDCVYEIHEQREEDGKQIHEVRKVPRFHITVHREPEPQPAKKSKAA